MMLIANTIMSRQGHWSLTEGAIVVEYNRIRSVGKLNHISRQFPGHSIVRLNNAVLMPGLVNAHTHLELPPLLHDIRAASYPQWVMNLLQAKKRFQKKDFVSAAKNNIQALIRSGTTTVVEICTHGISPEILKKQGLRAVIFHEIITMAQEVDRAKLHDKRPASRLLRYGISPHAPHTVSEAALRDIKRIAAKQQLPLSMHVAESIDEIRLLQCKRGGMDALYHAVQWDTAWAPHGRSPFEYLHRLGVLNPAFLAVHAVNVDDHDISLIRRSGAAIAHCPRSNRELGGRKMPLKKFLDARIPVGIGTDSLASAPSLNLWDEMRFAYQIHRRSGITPKDIFHLATLGGAKALGIEDEIGSLEPGKKADIIAVPLPRKNTGDLYSDLLRETKSCIMSMVNGKIIYLPENSERT